MSRGTAGIRQVAQRRYWREPEARILVGAWRGSGEKLAQFAQRHGFESRRLARWVHRLEENTQSVRFHAVRPVQRPPEPEGLIEIKPASGLRVPRGFEAENLRRVLRVLGEEGTC